MRKKKEIPVKKYVVLLTYEKYKSGSEMLRTQRKDQENPRVPMPKEIARWVARSYLDELFWRDKE